MPLTLKELAEKRLIDALATAYPEQVAATILLIAADYPRKSIPKWDTAMGFFLQVCLAIDAGTNPGAFEPLLRYAAQDHPNNQLFRPFAAPASPQDQQGDAPAPLQPGGQVGQPFPSRHKRLRGRTCSLGNRDTYESNLPGGRETPREAKGRSTTSLSWERRTASAPLMS